jgi:hypothetical protein
VRCYSGETYCRGARQAAAVAKVHARDAVRFTLDCGARTLALAVNGAWQGVAFQNVPSGVHPAASFYGPQKSVRLLHLRRLDAGAGHGEAAGAAAAVAAMDGERTRHCAAIGAGRARLC